MSDKNVPIYINFLKSEAGSIDKQQKIAVLSFIAKNHKKAITESGEGSLIRLKQLPDHFLKQLYEMVKKMIENP